jgi:hypothetical protein
MPAPLSPRPKWRVEQVQIPNTEQTPSNHLCGNPHQLLDFQQTTENSRSWMKVAQLQLLYNGPAKRGGRNISPHYPRHTNPTPRGISTFLALRHDSMSRSPAP